MTADEQWDHLNVCVKSGGPVSVITSSGQAVTGRLPQVDDTHLRIRVGDRVPTIQRSEVARIETARGAAPRRSSLLAIVIGGAAGMFALGLPAEGSGAAMAVGAAIGAALGALFGHHLEVRMDRTPRVIYVAPGRTDEHAVDCSSERPNGNRDRRSLRDYFAVLRRITGRWPTRARAGVPANH